MKKGVDFISVSIYIKLKIKSEVLIGLYTILEWFVSISSNIKEGFVLYPKADTTFNVTKKYLTPQVK